MALIIIGILIAVGGVVCFILGENRANDYGAILNDFYNTGTYDDGSTLTTIGIIVLVVGIILLVAGIIIVARKKNGTASQVAAPIPAAPPYAPPAPIPGHAPAPAPMPGRAHMPGRAPMPPVTAITPNCPHCGAKIGERNQFCMECGKPVNRFVICTDCGARSPEGSKFCMNCGEPFKISCPTCGEKIPHTAKFCLICGNSVAAKNEEPLAEPIVVAEPIPQDATEVLGESAETAEAYSGATEVLYNESTEE